MKKIYGHGDVKLKEIKCMPEGLKRKEPIKGYSVLAYGEISGHAHCLEASKTELYEDENGRVYLRCLDDVELKHQKLDGSAAKEAHETILLPKHDYLMVIDNEFDYFLGEVKKVED